MNISMNSNPGPGQYDLKTYNAVERAVKYSAMKKDIL
jgi:hypothetical protein